jgi:riboflavin kinase / FMN adenylyltransferase
VQVDQELAGYWQNRDSLITIGVFDGVHLGHKYLISKLKELAEPQGLRSIIITFDQHPQRIINPASHPLFLTDTSQKTTLLKNEKTDAVIVLSFTPELAALDPREFISLLQMHLRMKGLVVGPDFALGKNNQGNIGALNALGGELGFSVTVIPPVQIKGEIVSSTAIRNAMAAGDMPKVHNLMSRPFSLHGRVIHGKGRGAELGFPTVNLNVSSGQALPGDGVYATQAYTADKSYSSVTNVGKNPTFGKNDRTVEAFLLDFHDILYRHEVKIDFIQKLRGEIKFASGEHLKSQIARDILHARAILKNLAPESDLASERRI